MGMSAWGLLAAPLMAQGAPAPATAVQEPAAISASAAGEADIFSELSVMDENAMRDAAGGADTAIDIGNIGMNVSKNTGQTKDVEVNNSTTGQIANNAVNGNGGITTVFNNTGNGVVFQSNVNVNIFTTGPQQ